MTQAQALLIDVVAFNGPDEPVRVTARSFEEMIERFGGIYAFTYFRDRETAEEFAKWVFRNHPATELVVVFDLEEDAKEEPVAQTRLAMLRRNGLGEYKYMVMICFDYSLLIDEEEW